ncbi:hypothetical protein HPB50_010845 [Hyalomma asiaticum]|uniref:Uncharacterized protein n=1 Tax=Hyalomma asiaticum TaxID=266040 RepID=A0ACB7RT34_HYAAI|nr:hypothetical protein HPB50_010845 [Hyalomma asiaticum]
MTITETRTSRRSVNTRLINEARALLSDETATADQLNTLYGRLKVNNDELNKINEELESYIADEEFVLEYNTVVEYEDSATSVMSELLSRRDRVVSRYQRRSLGLHRQPVQRGSLEPSYAILPSTHLLVICIGGTTSGNNSTR